MATRVKPEASQPEEAPPIANGTPVDRDPMPVIAIDMPVMYEDEGQEEMGETEFHTDALHILTLGVTTHLQSRPELRVYSNLNVYYHRVDRWAYVSPDVFAVKPFEKMPGRVRSYRVGVHGPAPILAIEVLSRRSFQQQDLSNKPVIYSQLGVAEFILADTTAEFLEKRLLLRRLRDDGTWEDEQDPDGGVTSQLGFRIVIEDDDRVRVIDAASGKRYVRPAEAQESIDTARAAVEIETRARRLAEERLKALEAELARLRNKPAN
jgi:Uma2 family endonuclease